MQPVLAPYKRIFLLLFTAIAGVLPLALFLMWVEGDMSLPGTLHRTLQEKFSWPWIGLQESSLPVRAGFDGALLCILGGLPCLAASLSKRLVGPQISASLRTVLVGLGAFAVMSCWQFTGIVLWYFHLGTGAHNGTDQLQWSLDAAVFVVFLGFFFFYASQDWISALGFKQIYSTKEEALVLNSSWSPTLFKSLLFFAAAVLITPVMSFDRFIAGIFVLGVAGIIHFREHLAKRHSGSK